MITLRHSAAIISLALLLIQGADGMPDSVAVPKDTAVFILPIPAAGSVDPFRRGVVQVTEEEIVSQEYRSLYDVLGRLPGVFVRDLASPGQPNQLVINGVEGKNIAILLDGVPINDHYTGTVNLWTIPVDGIERVEYFSGAEGLFFDGKSGGGTINIVTRNFVNNRAITRLRYSQGISGYTQTDALFAQNVMNDMNLNFALTHYGFGSNKASQGYRARFYNSNTDSWILRTKVRYNISNTVNVAADYLYDRSWTGLHGGVNYQTTVSIFDGLQADVLNTESYEKNFNSLYTLSAAYLPFPDSSLLSTVTVYGSDRLREYRDEENRGTFRNKIFTQRDFASTTRGMTARVTSDLSLLRLLGYADLRQEQSRDIITLGARTELFPGSFFTVSPFITMKDRQNQFSVHAGATGTLTVSPALQFHAGVTQPLLHDGPGASVNNASVFNYAERTKETFSILEAGMRFKFGEALFGGITATRTFIHDPVVFDTIPAASSFFDGPYFYPGEQAVSAVTASLQTQWGEYHAEGTGTYLVQDSRSRFGIPITPMPELMLRGSVYFKGTLAKGALDLTMGIRGMYHAKQTGMRPYDEFGVWIPSTELTYGPSGTMDIFAVGKIGDAFVHLIWENVTGTQYLLAPVYPMYDRNIRFGLSWEFLD